MTLSGVRLAGSYRDPKGQVLRVGARVLRTVQPVAREQYAFIRTLMPEAEAAGFLVETTELPKDAWPEGTADAAFVLEHAVVPYVSYPYEWGFAQLQVAALHHLDFQIWLLERGAALSDATAYNVQFIGAKPVFIDLLSIIAYEEGSFWVGYRQFCEQFLNPLLLRACKGVAHNCWYRGALEGIATEDLAALLTMPEKLSPNVLTHVVLHARLQRRARENPDAALTRAKGSAKLSRNAYKGMLTGLRAWIARLRPRDGGATTWGEYAAHNSYRSEEAKAKADVIAEFVRRRAPASILDLGCNAGDYAVVALEAGASFALGFDFDQVAVDRAFHRAQNLGLAFLPLWLDAANASPNQGWRQAERDGFAERARADAVLALAFEHHLAIGKNIPLAEVVAWIVERAPCGLIEFVPKSDPTVQIMLTLREDIFGDYSEESFRAALEQVAQVVKKTTVSATGRSLYEYES
ncbi:class I SAM-dependent methyltransferase [Phaeovulum sp.]|uniref:class I SAM-dependent methyltransferase n=1 Tax=Phaeovulum sp. TaxID=2934796 RepID=UPI0035683543